jgi:hypothetical protein
MSPEEISTLALTTQINAMATGQNKIKSGGEVCYYGLGNTGDGLLAKAALQEGYDTIQLIHEAQLGCDEKGILIGFEIIDLRNPLVSSRLLRNNPRPLPSPALQQFSLRTFVGCLLVCLFACVI